ncbi:MAG: ABC transporter ATP-binding protein [Burkholderiales bacterium]|nr:ABC transporter ATP-binding protein [Burkholderiales bacterium]
MTAMLETRRLQGAYGGVRVLHDIALRVEPGEIVCILGANGAGKTSLLRAISNILVDRGGEVILAGADVSKLRAEAIVRHGVAHVPDGRGTFGHLSVDENLRLGAFSRRGAGAKEDRARALQYFPRLKERLGQQAGTLSGGEQQMLAIARALMLNPRVLLLDEPSFGLAPKIVAEIFQIIGQINRERGTSVLLVEQNAAIALQIAARAYLMETGRVVMQGAAANFRNDKAIQRAYLGT